jgi:hypothetical protein
MMQAIKAAVASHKNPFTETDGSWCLKRIMSFIASGVMLYKFCVAAVPDYTSFAVGFSAIVAALAVVNFAEHGDRKPQEEEEHDHASSS